MITSIYIIGVGITIIGLLVLMGTGYLYVAPKPSSFFIGAGLTILWPIFWIVIIIAMIRITKWNW